MGSKKTRKCDWCGKDHPVTEVYYPWDWIVCAACWSELVDGLKV